MRIASAEEARAYVARRLRAALVAEKARQGSRQLGTQRHLPPARRGPGNALAIRAAAITEKVSS